MPSKKLSAFLVFVLTASFYIFTLLPSLAWGDGTKLQSEAISGESFVLAEMSPDAFTPDPYPFSRVGVAAWDHPLYIILGYTLVKIIPFVNPLWLINLLSAIFGATSVALVFLLLSRLTGSLLAACYASLSLTVSHTFWWHSSTPEVYTLFVFLVLVSFYFFDQFERSTPSKHVSLFLSAFFLGLAASTHIMAFLIMPAMVLSYLFSKGLRTFHKLDLKKILVLAIAFLVGFFPYILQFIRMSVNFPLNEMIGPVVGSTFLSRLGTLSLVQLVQSILTYLFFLTVQFGPAGLFLGVYGFFNVTKDKNLEMQKINFLFIVFALFGIFYRVTDQFTFFIPSYIFWALLMGIGTNHVLNLLSRNGRFVFSSLLGLWVLVTPFFYVALPRIAKSNGIGDSVVGIPQVGTDVRDGLAYYINPDKRGDTSAYDFGERTILNLAPNSVVIAEWYTDTDEYFILRYFTKIEKLRSDITVVGWADQDPFYFDSQLALDIIADSFPNHPVYLASLSDKFYAASKLIEMYCILPENNLYRLYPLEKKGSQCSGITSVTE